LRAREAAHLGTQDLRQSLPYFVARFGSALIALAAIGAYTRLLSPALFGVFDVVNTAAMGAYFIFAQWLRFGLQRYAPSYEADGRLNALLSTILFGLALVAGALAIAGALAGFAFGATGRDWLLMASGFAVFLAFTGNELTLQLYNVALQSRRYAGAALWRAALTVGASLALLAAGAGPFALLWGAVLGTGLPLAASAGAAWGGVRVSLIRRSALRDVLRYGAPLTISAALALVIAISDRFIIAAYHGTAAEGAYAAPYAFTQRSLFQALLVANLTWFPVILRAYEAGETEKLRGAILTSARFILGVGLPLAAGLAVFSPVTAQIFFGAPFRDTAIAVGPLIAFGTLLQGVFNFHLSMAFSLPKATGAQIVVAGLGAAANLMMNFLWIPPYGPLGAAWATAASYVVVVAAAIAIGRRRLALPFPARDAAKAALACAVAAAVAWPMRAAAPASLVDWVALAAGVAAAGAALAAVLVVTDLAARMDAGEAGPDRLERVAGAKPVIRSCCNRR